MTGRMTMSRSIATLSTIAAVVGGVQLAAPGQAAAVPGLQRVASETAPFDNRADKANNATCPNNKVVLGGGAVVQDGGRHRVRLTESRPIHGQILTEETYYWHVAAEAPDLSRDYNWSITAYAICAHKSFLRDYEIRQAFIHNGTSATFDQVAARCPSGSVAYGAGAAVWAGGGQPGFSPTGQLGLQLVRTSGPLDIARATARESAAGYSGQWRLRSFAICADRQVKPHIQAPFQDSGIHADGSVSPGATATDSCPAGFRTHGTGGGGGLTDGGPSWLHRIYPHPDLRGVSVTMTGPLSPSIGGMIAHHTCALF